MGTSERLVTALDMNDRPVEGYEAAPILSPDGTKILFTRLGKGIFVVGSDGVDDHAVVNSRYAVGPVWSPDGQYIAYDDDFQGYSVVMIIKSDGTDKQQLSREKDEFDQSPAWKP